MKKSIFLVACMVVLMVGCRKEADFVPATSENSKFAYNTYTEQFEYLWKCMNTAYVFWDVDTVDWDAAYERMLPRFQDLDRKFADSGYVRLAELEALYTELVGKMRDHHMTFAVKNLHPAPGDVSDLVVVYPGQMEVQGRDYYIEDHSTAQQRMRGFLAGIKGMYSVSECESAVAKIAEFGNEKVWYQYCLFTLDDGRKVPYLWSSNAALTPVMRDMVGSPAQLAIEHWLTAVCNIPRSQLAGIILDTRSNGGGYQDDLDYLVGTFLSERTEIFRTRYKEGPGRLEHSVWCPYYQSPNPVYHRDITAENIPYVVLVDVNSVSMAEIEPMVIRQVLPTAHIIGERTYGGTGPLQSDAESLTYGAPFGNIANYGHYVYTSTFESMVGDKVREGVGLVPDEEVLRKDDPMLSFKSQLDAALRYLQSR